MGGGPGGLAPQAQGKGLEISASIAAGAPRIVVGDGLRLRQALTNLAGNAVKFTERGGVGVELSLADDGRVRFQVKDTGPGVPSDRRAAIFEDFEQGDGSNALPPQSHLHCTHRLVHVTSPLLVTPVAALASPAASGGG